MSFGNNKIIRTVKNHILADVKTGINKNHEDIALGAGVLTGGALLISGVYNIYKGRVLVGLALGFISIPVSGIAAVTTAYLLYRYAGKPKAITTPTDKVDTNTTTKTTTPDKAIV